MMILGGASRTGKGVISKKLMTKFETPYMSTDPIKMALHRSVPAYELNTSSSSIAVSEQLWPFLSTLIKNMVETGVNYIIEGEILPKHVRELSKELNMDIPTCFVGYAEIEPQEKVTQVRENSGLPNDWTSELSDSELLLLITDGIEYSRYLKEECSKNNLEYIDFSSDFECHTTKVINYFSKKIASGGGSPL